jgi:hypothetical protein
MLATRGNRDPDRIKKIERCGMENFGYGDTVIENLTNLEITILRTLEEHQGKEFSISRKELVEKINGVTPPNLPLIKGRNEGGISERQIRATIKHLTTQHGFAIGSGHKGYFMAITAEEIEGVCKYYDGYGLSSLFVSSKLRKIEMRDYLGQLSIKFGR